MSFEISPELRAQLIDDFHGEADEHLTQIRDLLGVIERDVQNKTFEPAPIDALSRNLHSLKGISAIVGLRAAEELAHAIEDVVRAVSKRTLTLNPPHFAALTSAVHRLEEVVGAHRLERPLPNTSVVIGRLGALAADHRPRQGAAEGAAEGAALPPAAAGDTRGAAKPDVAAVREAAAKGLVPWRCRFVPNKELDARGINLNTMRARLASLGEILRAAPQITPGMGISFEFVVGTRTVPDELDKWAADGVTFTPLHLPDPEPAPAPTGPEAGKEAESDPLSSLFIAPSHIVRVDLSRLDELMRLVGELVIHRSRLEERLHRAEGGAGKERGGLQEISIALSRTIRHLRDAIADVRLVPIGEIFTRMPFVVRDLGHEQGKKVRVQLEGQNTEVDKYLVERLKEPLLHLVRNAVVHGVELPEKRLTAGKTEQATLRLHARTVGESVLIEIQDDGGGIDAARVASKAAELQLPVPEVLDNAALLSLLCTPGFTTREQADLGSGRGVGMDVVNTTLRELGGSLEMTTEAGAGTTFTLRVPLTLSVTDVIVVAAYPQICAVPQAAVQELIEAPAASVRTVKRTEVIPYRDGVLPLVRLGSLFGQGPSTQDSLTIAVLITERGEVGLVVDRVLSQREVVVRPMPDPLVRARGIAGATELGDGKPVLILDAAALTAGVVRPSARLRHTVPAT